MERPVVATEVEEFQEEVIDGETGYLVQPQNPEKLAEKIIELLQNRDLREKMGKLGRERIEKFFSMSKIMLRTHYQFMNHCYTSVQKENEIPGFLKV